MSLYLYRAWKDSFFLIDARNDDSNDNDGSGGSRVLVMTGWK